MPLDTGLNRDTLRTLVPRRAQRAAARGVLVAACLFAPVSSSAAATEPTRTGLAASCGASYSPSGVSFCLLSGILLYDYDRVWAHDAPESLRFRVEGSLGAITEPQTRLMASVNIIAHLYYPGMSAGRLRPYVEGGIGIIYTDYKVEGQGWRFNFNPLLGLGFEFGPDPALFLEARIHHVSNAGLDEENTGVNSVQVMVGRYF